MTHAQEAMGQRFGKLRVLSVYSEDGSKVLCRCDCGRKHRVSVSHLLSGKTQSCGCLRRRQRNVTLEDVLKHCDQRGPDECWPWMGTLRNHGYGALSFRGKEIVATRAVMIAIHGPIPDGLIVCHKCDNPPCVNPAHLFIGTYLDNYRDMVAKGRGNFVGGTKLKYCRSGLHLLAESEYIMPSTGKRLCGICMRDRQNAWRRTRGGKKRATALALTTSGEQRGQ